MKYKDLFKLPLDWLQPQCLVWSANHEHAVFSIEDEVHPKAVYIWLGYIDAFGEAYFSYPPLHVIFKYKLQQGNRDWELSEISEGNIPFVSNNPFDPRKENAASNTAVSVFPQNQ